MSLEHWPAARVRRLWAVGLCAELAVVAGASAVRRATAPPEDPGLRTFAAWSDSVDRGQLPPAPALTPAQRARLAGFLRDSLGITRQRGGGGTEVQLPPPMAAFAGQALGGFLSQMLRTVLIGAALFLPIPLALSGLTAAWALSRWTAPRAEDAAPGV